MGSLKQPHHIDQLKCIKCGSCFDVCRLDAVKVVPKSAVKVDGNGHGNGHHVTPSPAPLAEGKEKAV
jgi:MinD superfamily P-loop ATPase